MLGEQSRAEPERAPLAQRTIAFGWLAAILFGATLLVYSPALRGGLLWDDPAHITRPDLRSTNGTTGSSLATGGGLLGAAGSSTCERGASFAASAFGEAIGAIELSARAGADALKSIPSAAPPGGSAEGVGISIADSGVKAIFGCVSGST